MDVTVSALEACPYLLDSLRSQLITEPLFIIAPTMSACCRGICASRFHLLKMDNRLLLQLTPALLSFLLSPSDPTQLWVLLCFVWRTQLCQ